MLTDGRPCRHEQHTEHRRHLPHGTGAPLSDRFDAAGVTADGAAWLASAGTYPRSTLALWEDRPTAPVVLPCGTAFDVVNAPAIFGRRMLDRLWDEGPGSGPVAVFRGRMLLFSAPGTAQRLPSLLEWEEWGSRGAEGSWDAWDSGALSAFDDGDGDGFDDRIGDIDSVEGVEGVKGVDGFRDPREPMGQRGGRGDAGPSGVTGVTGRPGVTGNPVCPGGLGRVGAIPPLLCHGTGDAVTVPLRETAVRPASAPPATAPAVAARTRPPVPNPAGWWPPTPGIPGSPAPRSWSGRPSVRPARRPPPRCGYRFSSRRSGC